MGERWGLDPLDPRYTPRSHLFLNDRLLGYKNASKHFPKKWGEHSEIGPPKFLLGTKMCPGPENGHRAPFLNSPRQSGSGDILFVLVGQGSAEIQIFKLRPPNGAPQTLAPAGRRRGGVRGEKIWVRGYLHRGYPHAKNEENR